MEQNLLILGIIIILSIILYKLYYSSDDIEGFDAQGNATDLLTKLKSYEAQITSATKPVDLELSIYPWTTKLHNLQYDNQVKPIGLYKPLLTIKGNQYTKLGDMVSQHNDYSPPDGQELSLLIKKQGSDIKPPTDFTKIISFGNPTSPPSYYMFEKILTDKTDLNTIVSNITMCSNAINNFNTLIGNNTPTIRNMILSVIGQQVFFQVGNTAPISVANMLSLPVNASSNSILATPITSDTQIKLPAGFNIQLLAGNAATTNFKVPDNINITTPLTSKQIYNMVSRNANASAFTIDNIQITTINNIGVFSLVSTTDTVNYLRDLCNNILNILNKPGISMEMIKYLNLADSADSVNNIINALSTIQPIETSTDSTVDITAIGNPFEQNQVISGYANTNPNTLLGSILNLIINFKITISYPSITFKPSQIGIININQLQMNAFNNNIINNLLFRIPSNNTQITNIANNILPNLLKLSQFQTTLANNKLDYFPLQIYAPVAPTGYVSLGHVFCNNDSDLSKIKIMSNVACVPQQCVKEMREWIPTDKVFEYNKDEVYWALYKNPYVGTFIAVNQPQPPEGKVCKVVACVAKCTAVEELRKADKCTREYYNLNKKIEKTTVPDLVGSTEESIYLQQIKEQNDNIVKLQQRAQQMQMDIDKAEIITNEMNKSKLQEYVDTQKRNIDLVATRLEADSNKISVNIKIPVDALNQLITAINNLPLTPLQKRTIINKLVENATQANKGLLTSQQYNANLNQIMKSCPQYDLSGLVKKSLVGDVCYGCGTPS